MSSISISNKGPSPPWPTRGLHQSQPTSPTYSEMNMSFQRVVSPEQADVGDKGAVEIIIEGQGDLASVDDGELEETEDTMGHMAEIPGATLNPRLNHISVSAFLACSLTADLRNRLPQATLFELRMTNCKS